MRSVRLVPGQGLHGTSVFGVLEGSGHTCGKTANGTPNDLVIDGGRTGSTFTVIVFGVGSVSMPPFVVPPLSSTWNVNVAYGVPLALIAGVNSSFPPVMSTTGMNWPAVTATLLSVSVPAEGNVVISTASSMFGGVSFGSVNPKSAAANVYEVFSVTVSVWFAPCGRSLTGVTVMFTVSLSVSAPP